MDWLYAASGFNKRRKFLSKRPTERLYDAKWLRLSCVFVKRHHVILTIHSHDLIDKNKTLGTHIIIANDRLLERQCKSNANSEQSWKQITDTDHFNQSNLKQVLQH